MAVGVNPDRHARIMPWLIAPGQHRMIPDAVPQGPWHWRDVQPQGCKGWRNVIT